MITAGLLDVQKPSFIQGLNHSAHSICLLTHTHENTLTTPNRQGVAVCALCAIFTHVFLLQSQLKKAAYNEESGTDLVIPI